MRSMPAVIAGVIVVGAILLTISFMDLSPDSDTNEQQIPTKVKVTISGGAWLTTSDGNSEVIRGLQVYLLPANASIPKDGALFRALIKMRTEDAERNIRNQDKHSAELLNTTDAFIAACSKATINTRNFMNNAVVLHKRRYGRFLPKYFLGEGIPLGFIADKRIARTATNVEGKYQLSAELQPGSYCVVALHVTEQFAVIWATEIAVSENSNLPLDLYNDTAELIQNK